MNQLQRQATTCPIKMALFKALNNQTFGGLTIKIIQKDQITGYYSPAKAFETVKKAHGKEFAESCILPTSYKLKQLEEAEEAEIKKLDPFAPHYPLQLEELKEECNAKIEKITKRSIPAKYEEKRQRLWKENDEESNKRVLSSKKL